MELEWLAVLLPVFFAFTPVTTDSCVKSGSCKCQAGSFTVDLNPLSAAGSADPRFEASDAKGNKYYFTPCKVLGGPSDCVSLSNTISVCQQSGTAYYDAGEYQTETFIGDPATDTLDYTVKSTSTADTRTSIFTLKCSAENRLEFVQENPATFYKFNLYTPQSCVNGIPEESKGLSTGSILVILFFVFFIVYWIVGFIFMKFVRRAEGVEMIPNYEFWKELPLLIRDGLAFTARGCKGETTYEKI